MEAPKLEQLLKVAEKRNPNWYPFVYGYLKGELDNLELDDDYFMDDYTTLDIGNNDACVVGETFGFTQTYKHGEFDNCFICGEYAQELFNNSNVMGSNTLLEVEDKRLKFAEILRDFYVHRGYMK